MSAQGPGAALAKHLLPDPPARLGVAVSGGSDSVALLFLLSDFARTHGTDVQVITVDHGLRAEATQEAAFVARLCADLSVPHTIARWSGWDRRGNLQDAARRARYRLMSDWAHARGIDTVALGHTLDDQAETVLMRLARGAGVDGLSAMTPRRVSHGTTWLRPLLDISRNDLRETLRRRNVTWCEDPGNEDTRFDRVRVRRALELLDPLGVTSTALGQVATHMAHARDALSRQAHDAATTIARIDRGAVRIDAPGFDRLPDEIARRIMVGALGWISGAPYPPRRRAVSGLIAAHKQGISATAEGCQISTRHDTLWVFREYDPVRDMTCALTDIWDGRWRLAPAPHQRGTHIGALGPEGLRHLPDWRGLGVARDVLLSTPAVWNGPDLVAAPLAGLDNGYHVELQNGQAAFFAALLSH